MSRIIRILDDRDMVWGWDMDEGWLDIEYPEEDTRFLGSGYPAGTIEEVLQILYNNGFISFDQEKDSQ